MRSTTFTKCVAGPLKCFDISSGFVTYNYLQIWSASEYNSGAVNKCIAQHFGFSAFYLSCQSCKYITWKSTWPQGFFKEGGRRIFKCDICIHAMSLLVFMSVIRHFYFVCQTSEIINFSSKWLLYSSLQNFICSYFLYEYQLMGG